jgi:hypothetical protein
LGEEGDEREARQPAPTKKILNKKKLKKIMELPQHNTLGIVVFD